MNISISPVIRMLVGVATLPVIEPDGQQLRLLSIGQIGQRWRHALDRHAK